MCSNQFGAGNAGVFDPTHCPLLQGLTTEEADRMVATDPRIRACMAAISSGTTNTLEPCVAKMVKAHDARAAKARAAARVA